MTFAGTPRFAIRRELGAGGMGVVYEALDREHDLPVALKLLHVPSRGARALLRQEFGVLRALRHPNLVALSELFDDDEHCFFTMELVRGVDFIEYLRPGGVGFDEARLRDALAQLTRGLMAIHGSGKVHRDIKPANVRVGADGRVVLLDFGLVTEADAVDERGATLGSGTVAYMAPEQAVGYAVGPEADWYSVGVILYEALVGERPFDGSALQIIADKQIKTPPPPRSRAADVPEDLDALCCELLQIEPERRPSGRSILRRLGLREAPRGVPSPFVPPSTIGRSEVWLGRRAELAQITAALADARAGRQVAVIVHGASGMGKSALLRAFVSGGTASADMLVLPGQCHAHDAAPFPGMAGVIQALAAQLGQLPADELECLRPERAALLLAAFPAFKQVAALADAPVHEILDPLERRVAMFAALRELLGRLAARRTVVLVIDDLEHADTDALMLLGELLRPPAAPATLLLASAAHPIAGLPGDVRELELGALPAADALELARLLLARAQHSAATAHAAAIAAAAGGSPRMLGELVTAGVLAPEQAWPRAADGTIDLAALIAPRIAALDPVPRHIVELVATAAAPLDQAVAAASAGVDPPGLVRHAALLQVLGLLQVDPEARTVAPCHQGVRAAALAPLTPVERVERHRQLLRALEASGHAAAHALAHHHRHAGLPASAGNSAVQAAAAAETALAFDLAARCYRQALELLPGEQPTRPALQAALGDALARSGRGQEAARAYLLAVEGSNAAVALDLQRRAGQQLLLTGHVEEGIATLRRILAAEGISLPETPRRALPSLLWSRLRLRLRGLGHHQGDARRSSEKDLTRLDACLTVGTSLAIVDPLRGHLLNVRGLLLALRAGEPARLAGALALEGAYRSIVGKHGVQEGGALFDAAEALAREVDDPRAQALVLMARGQVAVLDGRFAIALELCQQAETLLRERCIGAGFELSIIHGAIWNALQYLGAHGRIAVMVPALLQELDRRGDVYHANYLRLQAVPFMCLAADDPARSWAEMAQALPRWASSGFHTPNFHYLLAAAAAHLYASDGRAALGVVHDRWRELERSFILRVQACRIVMFDLRGRAALAAALAAGPDERPRLHAQAARDARRLERERVPWADALAGLLRAGVAAARGEAVAARAQLTGAITAFERVDMALHAEVARRTLGRLIGGDEGRALVAGADAWMATQAIVSPARMSALLAPAGGRHGV